MKYSQQEKLQVMMLCEIYRALDIKNSFDPDLIEQAVSTDQYWALDWEYSGISSGEETPHDVKLFVDTYDMYDILKYTYDRFSDEDKTEVSGAISHFNEKHSLSFPGFDGNNETQYLTIGSLLKTMGRFTGKEDLTKNSHMRSVEIYQRMLEVFLPARANQWTHNVGITKDAFINTLNARIHPENR
ncbi:YfbU family protein [Pectobacterium actinidiae]|uniref:YfbU family protein n=1 Tax=Pectobacterium actinidiae TaxID=1507808 RepID=A0ABW8G8H8_9GAMM